MTATTVTKKPVLKKLNVSFEDLVRRDAQRSEDQRRTRLQKNVQKAPGRNYWVEHLNNVLTQKLGVA